MSIVFKEINYGIASRIGSTVYLHKGLRKYPELREALIQHELGHSSGYTKKDLLDDFGIKELRSHKKDYYNFILNTPSSWSEYLPVCRYEGQWIISPTLALYWLFAIGVSWIVVSYVRSIF